MLWFTMAVAPQFSWPYCRVEITFEGLKYAFMPRHEYSEGGRTHELAATISVFDPEGVTLERGGTLVSRF